MVGGGAQVNDTRPSRLVRLARLAKGDQAFDIDPAIRSGSVLATLLRRVTMLVRGAWLVFRPWHPVFPVFVGRGVVGPHAPYLRLGRGVTIEDYCRLDCLGREGVVLGDGATPFVEAFTSRSPACLGRIGEGCILGEGVGVSEGSYLGARGLLTIGADTILGPQCIVVAENHLFAEPGVPIREQGVERRGVAIGGDCWLGAAVRVLDGVSIGRGAVIGAGAVVAMDMPENCVAVGVPARVIRARA